MPLLNVNHTSLLNRANLYFLPGDEELVRPAPHVHLLTLRLLVPLNHPPLMIILTCMLFYEFMQKLSMPHSRALFRSVMMSSVE